MSNEPITPQKKPQTTGESVDVNKIKVLSVTAAKLTTAMTRGEINV